MKLFWNNKNFLGKEAKKMKRVSALVIAIIFMLWMSEATAAITTLSDWSRVITYYNPFGIGLRSTTTTETTTKTTEGSQYSTNVSTSVVESLWRGGSLKPITINNTSNTTDSDGSRSTTNIKDTYGYDSYGKLTGASGSGTYSATETNGQSSTGTVARTFIVKNAQALLTQSKTQATIKSATNQVIGSSTNTNTINASDYEYKGGSWVAKKTVSGSSTNMNDGSSTNFSRTLTYTRNTYGVVTGLGQTATGTRVDVLAQSGGTLAKKTYDVKEYKVTPKFDSKEGWYIESEDYKWVLR